MWRTSIGNCENTLVGSLTGVAISASLRNLLQLAENGPVFIDQH
jgi:hypothetical protein